jgi:radical SAM superfamily enzyme YgiQ (UPF0313 family)
VDSVVLENPTWKRFERQVTKGHFQVICITFSIVTSNRVLRMATWIRETFPDIEIVLGGYGTAIFEESMGIEIEILKVVDHVCKGEGLSFMRQYLKDRWKIECPDGEIKQDFLPSNTSLFRTHNSVYSYLNFLVALGCNYQCSFCATSHQYQNKKLEIVSSEQLYRLLRADADRHPKIQSALFLDENFLENRANVLEFIELMKKDEELINRPLLLTVFTTASSLSKYTIKELIQCGIGVVYIGVESFQEDILAEEHLVKRGPDDIHELFNQMHEAGILTVGSIIVGWDHQTHESARAELAEFVTLNPTLYQVMPLQAIPGTRLWKKMDMENRLVENLIYDNVRIDRATFHYKNLSQEEVVNLIDNTYIDLVNEGGPWPFRMFEIYQKGIVNLSDHPEEEFRMRAKAYSKLVSKFFPLAFISIIGFRGKGFRRRWRQAMIIYYRRSRYRFISGALLGALALPAITIQFLFGSLLHFLSANGDQPETYYAEYRGSKI